MPNIQALSNTPSPADFPVGSPESRAAARSLLDARVKAEGGEGVLVRIKLIGVRDEDRKCTCKPPAAGTFAICRCFG